MILTLGGALGAGSVLVAGCSKDEGSASEQKADPSPAAAPVAEVAPPPVDDETLAESYRQAKALVERDPAAAAGPGFDALRDQLRQIAERARDPHLQANASLLLGSLFEARGAPDRAVDFYRHAAKLVPDDAGPHMALALALAETKRWKEAAEVQARATELDPDNLENWLALGQMHFEAGHQQKARDVYVDYERRRRGLIDGLTLQKGEDYAVDAKEREGCARALAAATDVGTANALIYALKSEPEPAVRAAVAQVMGIQRISGYRPALEAALKKESSPDVREALKWALSEIAKDPVDVEQPIPKEVLEATKTESGESADEGSDPTPDDGKAAEPPPGSG